MGNFIEEWINSNLKRYSINYVCTSLQGLPIIRMLEERVQIIYTNFCGFKKEFIQDDC